ncbi:hypothetical protein LTR08_003062 [Meristemomyces frigidus]|nr:hypothetical protein LTR08_003062 [Meristemomyces frigidus]
MAEPRCYILELPKELRLIIYAELLRPHTLRVYWFDKPSIVGMAAQEIATTRCFTYSREEEVPRQPLYPGILRTCRQFYAESCQLLYTPEVLRLYPLSDTRWTREGKLNMENFRTARRLQELVLELIATPLTALEDVAHSTFFAGCFRDDIQPGTVVVVLRDQYEQNDEPNDNFNAFESMLSTWSKMLRPAASLKVELMSGWDNVCCWAAWKRSATGEWSVIHATEPGEFEESVQYPVSRQDRFYEVVKKLLSKTEASS